MNDDIMNVYLLSIIYKKMFDKDLKEDDLLDLFPMEWYEIKDDKLKIEILQEAIKEKIKVYETQKYIEATTELVIK